jgi:hypothetical protein
MLSPRSLRDMLRGDSTSIVEEGGPVIRVDVEKGEGKGSGLPIWVKFVSGDVAQVERSRAHLLARGRARKKHGTGDARTSVLIQPEGRVAFMKAARNLGASDRVRPSSQLIPVAMASRHVALIAPVTATTSACCWASAASWSLL